MTQGNLAEKTSIDLTSNVAKSETVIREVTSKEVDPEEYLKIDPSILASVYKNAIRNVFEIKFTQISKLYNDYLSANKNADITQIRNAFEHYCEVHKRTRLTSYEEFSIIEEIGCIKSIMSLYFPEELTKGKNGSKTK